MKPPSLSFLLIFLNGINKNRSIEQLRGTTLILIVITLVSLLSILYSITSSLLLSNIKLAEEKNVNQSVQEVLREYTEIADDLYYINLAWSEWDDTYEFAQNPQETYIKENLSPESFPDWKFDLAIIFKKNGKKFFAKEWDTQSHKAIQIPALLEKQIYPENILVQFPSSGKSVTGLIILPKGITLISSLPILDTKSQRSSRGGFALGRYAQKSEIVKRISGNNFLTASVSLYSVNEAQMPPDFEQARLTLSDKNSIVVQNLGEQKIAGYTWLKDIYGKQALLVRVVKNRELYLQGKKNLSYLLVSLIVVGVIFGIATQILLQKIISFQLKRQESEVRYRVVIEQAAESIFLVDAETKHFLEANTAFEKLLGYSLKEILSLTINDIVVENCESHAQYLQYIETKAEYFTGEKQYCSRDGYLVDVEVNVNLISWAGKQVFCHVVRDITERKKAEAALRTSEQRLAWQANHDALTGLVNRRKFEQHLEQALHSARVTNSQHSLCYLDLDRFKIVNDTCGHIAGDELLRQVTALLQSQVRSVDVLARLGGDEFGLLLDRCTLEQAVAIANALRETIQAFQFIWEEKTFRIGVSIGIVAIAHDSHSLIDTLRHADIACYAAKNQGRDRVQIYQLGDRALKQSGKVQWIEQINKALAENHFCLYYQSIAPTSTQLLPFQEHYEVLLRLRDETTGKIIPPMAFIPAAERYNLMQLIDRWVITTLFASQGAHYRQTYADCQKLGGFCLYTINLSGASINDDRFTNFLHEQIELCQIPPQVLCFEITETVAITNLTKAVALINEFKQLGCSFALDDFGLGMSSFGYLKKLPVDYLKIDGSFIKDILTDSTDLAMTEAINQVGHVMGLKTIAEFVENDDILAKIRNLGVDYAQGYGIAKPRPLAMSPSNPQKLTSYTYSN